MPEDVEPEDVPTVPTVTQEEFDAANVPETGKVAKNTFELGLVLAGTVSAGAYTAGFVDFLIEAMDQYEEHGIEGAKSNPHKVLLKVIAGTSGGGMVSAQLGRALFRDFKPMDFAATSTLARQNTLFDAWVDQIDIKHLTSLTDMQDAKAFDQLDSLLNSDRIEQIARDTLTFRSGEGNFKRRGWVSDTLDVVLTHFNMRGMPYRIPYATIGGKKRFQSFREHADHLRFQIFGDPDGGPARPDAIGIDARADAYPEMYALAAVGTGAFPGALRAPLLTRPLRHYLLRSQTILRPTGDPANPLEAALVPMEVDTASLAEPGFSDADQEYDYVVVDGGVANNEPLELARTTLSGLLGRNPRAADKANRGVVMVAPLHSAAGLPVGTPMNSKDSAQMVEVMGNLIGSVRRQMSFSTGDLQLAGDENVHSRFMVLPSRMDIHGNVTIGEDAIACSGLAAFLGFLDRRYRLHDYRLGRRNAWQFLANEFWLSADNPVFNDWSQEQKDAWIDPADEEPFLPLVPLVGTAATAPGFPNWPKGGLRNRQKVEKAIDERVHAVLDIQPLKDPEGSWFNIGNAASEFGEWYAKGKIMDFIRDALDDELHKKGLD